MNSLVGIISSDLNTVAPTKNCRIGRRHVRNIALIGAATKQLVLTRSLTLSYQVKWVFLYTANLFLLMFIVLGKIITLV